MVAFLGYLALRGSRYGMTGCFSFRFCLVHVHSVAPLLSHELILFVRVLRSFVCMGQTMCSFSRGQVSHLLLLALESQSTAPWISTVCIFQTFWVAEKCHLFSVVPRSLVSTRVSIVFPAFGMLSEIFLGLAFALECS